MVKRSTNLDSIFLALADPTRRAILQSLRKQEASVSELAQPYSMSLPAVMKHLSVLERAGLVSHRKIGRTRHCRLVPQPMAQADRWLADYRIFWEQRLDSLDRFLQQQDQQASAAKPATSPTKE